MSDPKAVINVTPLIDILLVLLIVFMIISPLQASKFEAKIPQKPEPEKPAGINPDTLIVRINTDASLDLNSSKDFGTIDSPEKMIRKLKQVFLEREENNNLASKTANLSSFDPTIEKTVFIRAPRSLHYGKVVNVIDAVKIAGAKPISLQIDDLD